MKAIVMTKSRMNAHGASGCCTTVYDLNTNKILRLVSNQDGAPIPNPYNHRYECLDLIDAEIIQYCPVGAQQENVLVKLNSIKKVCHPEIKMDRLFSLCRCNIDGEPLYMDDISHKLESVQLYHHSLELLRVRNLVISRDAGHPIKATFTAADAGRRHYQYFSVTDPNYILNNGDSIKIGDAYIAVSIPSVPFNDGFYYKFVAAIYPVNQ